MERSQITGTHETMNSTAWKCLFLFTSILFLSSCSGGKKIVDLNLKYITANSTPVAQTDQAAQSQVAEAATAVGQSMQDLSAVQMTVHPPKGLKQPYDPSVIGMGKMASISWTGPVGPLLRQITKATGYHFQVVGRKPTLPILVSLNINNQPVAYILRNITYQIVMKASIAIYPKRRIMELRYRGN